MAEAGPVRDEIVVFDEIGNIIRSRGSGDADWTELKGFGDAIHGDICTFSAVAARDTLYVLVWRRWVFCIKPYEEGATWVMNIPNTVEGHGPDPPAASIGDIIYVCGGGWKYQDLNNDDFPMHPFSSKCEEYDPLVGEWKPIADMANAKRRNSLVVAKGDLYCIGGLGNRDDENIKLNEVERYHRGADRWTSVTGMNTPRVAPAVAAMEDTIYVLGGGNDNGLNSVDCYNISNDTWTDMGRSMISPRTKFRACIIGSHIYAVGGDSLNTVEKYNLTDNSGENAWELVRGFLTGMKINNMATVVMTKVNETENSGR